ncbi:MAG: D-amino acid dehydrogenase [Devosia sp.]|nr:D-amino acid dehydrogenase [Devosia sp.]
MDHMRVLIVGAGISGVTTAYLLARAGCEVTVVDRGTEPAEETSFANGGVVGGTQIEPWASPGLQWNLLKWLGREDAPLLVRWREIPRLMGWGLRFLSNCDPGRFHRNLAVSGRLTRHSLAKFADIRETANIAAEDYDLIRRGALKLYFTDQSYAHACADIELMRKLGFDVREVDARRCVALEPGLAPVANTLTGGVSYAEEEVGDCRAFTRVLARRARELGVAFRFGTQVWALQRAGDRLEGLVTDSDLLTADSYVIATASYSAPLLKTAGIGVPVIPAKGLTISVPADPWPDAVRSAVMDHSRLFGLIRIGSSLRVSGSAELTGYDTTAAVSRANAILAGVTELFPEFQRCLDAGPPQRWAGVRGLTPDGPPILGPTGIANLYLNIGHGPQGWSTSCGSADLVADLVIGREPAISMEGLTLARFGAR